MLDKLKAIREAFISLEQEGEIRYGVLEEKLELLDALIAEQAADPDRYLDRTPPIESESVAMLVGALQTFDEAMRNGSTGPDADKQKQKALKAAHRKALAALASQGKEASNG